MTKKASTTHLIQFKWNSDIVKELIDAFQNYKAVCRYHGFDFNSVKVKQFDKISRNLARKYKEEYFFATESLSEKLNEDFSTDEDKIGFCKKLQRE